MIDRPPVGSAGAGRLRAIVRGLARLAMLFAPALTAQGGDGAPPASDPITPAERAFLRQAGPWPPATELPSTEHPGASALRRLGRALFFEPRLSPDGVRCSDCHDPARAFQDGRARAHGRRDGARNTIGLLDAAGQRWYGWDGASDSLWAASLRPMLADGEMGGSLAAVARLLRTEPALGAAYRRAWGDPVAQPDEAVAVRAARALAAWQSTLVSPRTPFDAFRDAVLGGDSAAAARYPVDARRGMRLFAGRAACTRCHFGPRLASGEFADVGRRFFVAGGGVDPGRHGGVLALRSSRYNRLGLYGDTGGAAPEASVPTRHLRLLPTQFGEFKVPTLRQLSWTAPYWHDGSGATLDEVVRHYSEFDEDRLHADGPALLQPLHLSAAEAADLVAFLRSLSSATLAAAPAVSAGGDPDAEAGGASR